MIYDPNFLSRFEGRTPAPAHQNTNWSLWERLAPGLSIFTRIDNGTKIWAWGENPYTCPAANIVTTKELAYEGARKS